MSKEELCLERWEMVNACFIGMVKHDIIFELPHLLPAIDNKCRGYHADPIFPFAKAGSMLYIHIWSRFAVRYHPPPPHGMVPKPAFCSIPHENVVFAVFFAWWVAGAVRNPANSLDFCNQPSENVLFAMFRLRHRGVVPPRPLLFLCQIII